MIRTFKPHKYLFLGALLLLVCFSDHRAFTQREGHVMPGATKSKPKAKPKTKPRSTSKAKPRRPVKHPRSTPRKLNLPAQPNIPKPESSPAPHVHTPEVNSGNPVTTPSSPPAPLHTHKPDMNMPFVQTGPSPEPGATPHKHVRETVNTPSMDKPETPETHMHTPATPSASPTGSMPTDHSGHMSMPATPHVLNEGLLVMTGDDMGIRVGANVNNIMPMGQMASGTSWQPASTQMNMLHKAAGDWLVMFHYNAIVGVNSQGGQRGVTKFELANWFMPMTFRKVGKGTLELRGMFSLEPFTFPPGGSPLLFQTGETYKGRPIIDAQHPHDLVMELSATYTTPVGDRATWFAYLGYPGEPALGPTAFMHRASASENPSAVLSHHLQDSSHITFGVFTTGFTYRWFKVEGSVFNGREPDENRYNFEAHPWNSRSARFSFAPNSNWSMQVSHGFLRNPEALETGDVRRTTASITYNKPLAQGYWATSFIWGRNHESHNGEIFDLDGYVGESTVNFRDKNYVYTRLESVDKNQLLRAEDRLLLGITDHHAMFHIGAYTFGGARDLYSSEKLRVAIGGDVTLYSKPEILDMLYGDKPASYRVFLRLRPGKMSMSGQMGDMGNMKH